MILPLELEKGRGMEYFKRKARDMGKRPWIKLRRRLVLVAVNCRSISPISFPVSVTDFEEWEVVFDENFQQQSFHIN